MFPWFILVICCGKIQVYHGVFLKFVVSVVGCVYLVVVFVMLVVASWVWTGINLQELSREKMAIVVSFIQHRKFGFIRAISD